MKKNIIRLMSLVLSAILTFAALPVTQVYATTSTANYTYTYCSKYSGSSNSLVDALKAVGVDSSFSNRQAIAALNGYSSYSGTSAQNTELLTKLKNGTLIKSKTATSCSNGQSSTSYYPRYTGSSNSLVDALKAVGVDSSFSNRQAIAALNGYSSYSGTSAQNTELLAKLKNGTLIKSKTDSSGSTTLISANLNKINYNKQGTNTCKASSVAMALNLIIGKNTYTTASMGGSCCKGINGNKYIGSDGNTYKATYRSDSYVGSLTEVKDAINKSLSAGLPIVVAVHSSGTKHHWIVIVGQSGNNYLIVDPWGGSSGSMSFNVKSMSSYQLGLTDYKDGVHYGYVSFSKA